MEWKQAYIKEGCSSADTIDNADDPPYIYLNYFLPDAPYVDVIITSRSLTTAGDDGAGSGEGGRHETKQRR
jgi:hypothetical protein